MTSKGKHILTTEYLANAARNLEGAGYPVSKWISFSQDLIRAGYTVDLHVAKTTVSKYLYVTRPGSTKRRCKIRFSNHEPAPRREEAQECDYYVGKLNNGTWQTTHQARAFVEGWFTERNPQCPNPTTRPTTSSAT